MGAVARAVGSAIDAVVSFVGKPFGIYTHEETFSDIQISNLLTPGAATKSAKKTILHSSMGNPKLYQQSLYQFKKDYRKKYSKKFLENLGYNPTSTGTTKTLTKDNVFSYVETKDSEIEEIIYYSKLFPNKTQIAYNYLQNTYSNNWSNKNEVLYNGNPVKTYINPEITVNNDVIDIKLAREWEETIIQDLTDNYNYDINNNTVTIDSELYDVPELSSSTSGDPLSYTTTVISQSDGSTIDIQTPVEYFNDSVSSDGLNKESLYVYYYRDTDEEYSYIEPVNTLPDSIYETIIIDMTAIVTLKENNVIVDTEDQKLVRMLRRLNIEGEQLKSSLENPDLDGAYLLTGLPIETTTKSGIALMYDIFDLTSNTSGNVSIDIDSLSMTYNFSLEKKIVNGSIGDVGITTKEISGSGSSSTLTLRRQQTSDIYTELLITNFSQQYTISGQSMTAYLTSTSGYCRLIIPLQLLNNRRYNDFVEVYEESLCLLAFSTETVELKWYETGAFGTLLKIAAVVFTVMTFGVDGGATFAATNAAFASTITALGITDAATITLLYSITVFVESALISSAIAYGTYRVGKAIGGNIGAILAAITAIYLSYSTGRIDATTFKQEQWLRLADSGLNTINQIKQNETNLMLANNYKIIEATNEKIEELKEKIEEYENEYGGILNFNMNIVTQPNPIFYTTEQYVNSIINTDWLVSSGWLYAIDETIEMKNKVLTL